jgi:hypothetical protein
MSALTEEQQPCVLPCASDAATFAPSKPTTPSSSSGVSSGEPAQTQQPYARPLPHTPVTDMLQQKYNMLLTTPRDTQQQQHRVNILTSAPTYVHASEEQERLERLKQEYYRSSACASLTPTSSRRQRFVRRGGALLRYDGGDNNENEEEML